ncbi:hypothetical protein N0V90_007314 [Kalmusia sp. IMI 367209]|nr:hypothetical protein N0V90_007314 [Kalmusia sp. IMI 367209]
MAAIKTTIPKGSLILITGATGFVASHVAKQFLERGYRVRGTVRDLNKASWLVSDVFKVYADQAAFELILVPDFTAENAFSEAVKGVAAIAHVAAATDFDPDPNNVIPQAVTATTSLMEAALRESSILEFVYTSSIVTATMPVPGNSTRVERHTWNDLALQLAWAPPPYEPERGPLVYMASKVAAEKAVWEFSEQKKPRFAVNAICPPAILGEPLDRTHVEVKAAYIKLLAEGKTEFLETMPATLAVNVKDVALLHVAAILDPDVQNARIQPWAQFCDWNDMLTIMRKLLPQRKFIDDLPNLTELSLSTDTTQPLSLLKKWGNQDGWVSLEETVKENLMPVVKWGY